LILPLQAILASYLEHSLIFVDSTPLEHLLSFLQRQLQFIFIQLVSPPKLHFNVQDFEFVLL